MKHLNKVKLDVTDYDCFMLPCLTLIFLFHCKRRFEAYGNKN